MPRERLARRFLLATLVGSGPEVDRGRGGVITNISDLPWSRLGVEPAELSDITEKHEVFQDLLGYYLRDLTYLGGKAV